MTFAVPHQPKTVYEDMRPTLAVHQGVYVAKLRRILTEYHRKSSTLSWIMQTS